MQLYTFTYVYIISWLTSAPAAQMWIAVKRHAYKTAPTLGRFCRFGRSRFVLATRQAMGLDAHNRASRAPAGHHRIVPLGVHAPTLRSDDGGVILSNGDRLEFRSGEMQRVMDALV